MFEGLKKLLGMNGNGVSGNGAAASNGASHNEHTGDSRFLVNDFSQSQFPDDGRLEREAELTMPAVHQSRLLTQAEVAEMLKPGARR